MSFDSSLILGVESLLHSARLIVEYARELRYRSDVVDVIGFQLFCTALGLRQVVGSWLDERVEDNPDVSVPALTLVVCILPSVAFAVELVVMRLFSFAVVLASILLLVDPCVMRVDVSIALFLCLELHGGQLRSNLLRLLALGAFMLSALTSFVWVGRYLAVVGLELSSWATERYMLPWRISSGKGCCGEGFRFLLGFFVGVHIVNGEEPVLLRPCDRRIWCFPETIRGVSFSGSDVFLRYRASPMGVLFAYLEGLSLVPFRIAQEEDGQVNAFFLGVHVLQFSVVGWKESVRDDAFAAATRFPFRRLLLGVLLRTATVDTNGLLFQ